MGIKLSIKKIIMRYEPLRKLYSSLLTPIVKRGLSQNTPKLNAL